MFVRSLSFGWLISPFHFISIFLRFYILILSAFLKASAKIGFIQQIDNI